MITVPANLPGNSPTKVDKIADQKISILIDFKALLREDHHERLVKIIALDADGATVEKSRCNAGQMVQLDLGAEDFPTGEPHIFRNIKVTAEVCPEGELSATVRVQVFP